jgi:hypothetical protein
MDIKEDWDFVTEAENLYVEKTANPSGVTDAQAKALRVWDRAMCEWKLGGPEGDIEYDNGTIEANPHDDEILYDASKALLAAFADSVRAT